MPCVFSLYGDKILGDGQYLASNIMFADWLVHWFVSVELAD